MKNISTAIAIIIMLFMTACISKGPLRTYPGAIYEFSDDQSTRIEIDINRVLFNEICVPKKDRLGTPFEIPDECFKVEGGLLPGDTEEQKRAKVEDTNTPSTLEFQTWNTDGNQVFSSLIMALEHLPDDRKLAIRNATANQLIFASEHACRNYLFTLVGVQTNTRFGTEMFAGIASTAASLTDATDPSNLYSALSALSIMGSASLDRNYFANQAVEVIRLAIDKNRTEKRNALRKKLVSTYADYPFGIAMADIVQFHSSCSLMEGLADTKEAIIDRETAIRGARNIAARLNDTGANGRQIVAALTGLEESHFGLPSDEPGAIASSAIEDGVSQAEILLITTLKPGDVDEASKVDAVEKLATGYCASPKGLSSQVSCELSKPLDSAWFSAAKALLKAAPAGETADQKKARLEANSQAFSAELQKALEAKKQEVAARRHLAATFLRILATPTLSQQSFDELQITDTFLFDDQLSPDPAVAMAQLALRNQPGPNPPNTDVKQIQPAATRALEVFNAAIRSKQ